MKHWQLTTDEQGIAWLTFDQAETTVNTLNSETLAELGVARDFVVDAEPLIAGEAYPPYRDGLPDYVRPKLVSVRRKLKTDFVI